MCKRNKIILSHYTNYYTHKHTCTISAVLLLNPLLFLLLHTRRGQPTQPRSSTGKCQRWYCFLCPLVPVPGTFQYATLASFFSSFLLQCWGHPRALSMLSKISTTEPHPRPPHSLPNHQEWWSHERGSRGSQGLIFLQDIQQRDLSLFLYRGWN